MLRIAATLCTIALTLALVSPGEANPACGSLLPVGLTVLDGDLDCTSSLTDGLELQTDTVLDCAGYTITGPDMGVTPGTQTGRYGLRISDGAKRSIVQNCAVQGYERGLRFTNAKKTTVRHSSFCNNVRYGMNYDGFYTWGNVANDVVVCNNGDEGVHWGGPFGQSPTVGELPNRIKGGSQIFGNLAEGLYLLNANDVRIAGSFVYGNGAAGIYVKQSPDVVIENMTVMQDYVHAPNSTNLSIIHTTVEGGFVKLEGTSATLDGVCVVKDALGNPSQAFYLVGSPDVTILNGGVLNVNPAVNATSGSTGIVVTNLTVSPYPLRLDADATSGYASTSLIPDAGGFFDTACQ